MGHKMQFGRLADASQLVGEAVRLVGPAAGLGDPFADGTVLLEFPAFT